MKYSIFSLVIAFLVLSANRLEHIQNLNLQDNLPGITGYPIVGTNQTTFYNNQNEISEPGPNQAFFGQNANYPGTAPKYQDNGDGTITDLVTGLMWSKSPDLDGNGEINATDKLTYAKAKKYASKYNQGGYQDWRLPTIKELYSLILFSGTDPRIEDNSTDALVPFIHTEYFDFAFGDTDAGERIIDAQFASSSSYVDGELLFGVNFADGRIKGYGLKMPFGNKEKTFFVLYVRGRETYGINDFQDNQDGTILDKATRLMWMAEDSGNGMNWKEALSYAENAEFAGYTDWRLPNVKELQSIIDYNRSPGTTNSAAIDPLFFCSEITNEAGQIDYPFYWSSTTHAKSSSDIKGGFASYVSFGRAMGYMSHRPMRSSNHETSAGMRPPPPDRQRDKMSHKNNAAAEWMDVHGAGAQRSDPKMGNPADFAFGHGPQGDAIRIHNFVRLVRNSD